MVGGLVDVAPTIADLRERPTVPTWQGRSLFARERSGRAYFFSTWTSLLFGYREGERKYILDATENRYEVYDLAADARENVNLGVESPQQRVAIQHRLAAWVQYQSRVFDGLVEVRAAE